MDINDLLERLGRLPRSQRVAAIAIIYVLFGVVFYLLVYSPQQGEFQRLENKRTELRNEKRQVEKRARNKDEFEQELADLTAQLRQALRQLPDNREIPDLLSKISSTGRRIGLEIRKFLPKDESMKEYHAEVPVQLELQGSYHEVAMFFDRLSKMSRIVYVQDIQLTKPEESSGKVLITVEGTLTTFRFLSDEERKTKTDDDSKKRRSRRGSR